MRHLALALLIVSLTAMTAAAQILNPGMIGGCGLGGMLTGSCPVSSSAGAALPGGFMLLESSGYLLLENGGKICLEGNHAC